MMATIQIDKIGEFDNGCLYNVYIDNSLVLSRVPMNMVIDFLSKSRGITG